MAPETPANRPAKFARGVAFNVVGTIRQQLRKKRAIACCITNTNFFNRYFMGLVRGEALPGIIVFGGITREYEFARIARQTGFSFSSGALNFIETAQQGGSRINNGQFGVAGGRHRMRHRPFQAECRLMAAESALSCAPDPRNVIRICDAGRHSARGEISAA